MKTELTLDDLLGRIEKLEQAVFGKAGSKAKTERGIKGTRRSSGSKALDFSMPIRAFIKKHGADMNGPKKFTLLLAYLTKGDERKRVPSLEIEKHWNKMTAKGLLGIRFNRLYSAKARENDWVNAEKGGSYYLRPGWDQIF